MTPNFDFLQIKFAGEANTKAGNTMNPCDSFGLNNRPQEVAEELPTILGGLLE